ncbi:MAG: propionyl-CoA synthetase, partial [Sedimentitalea sp.]|nr:propionyl-CoA synthetase [Sedimentitalea sp.]
MSYASLYESWKRDPEAFWMEAAAEIDWETFPTKALHDENAPFYEWYSDGTLNGCYNAVDRHVEAGHGARTAIIYDSPITQTK